MLSKKDIQKELGKNILIVPFETNNIKDNSINLCASKLVWSTVTFSYIQIDNQFFLPNEVNNGLKETYIYKGESCVIIDSEGNELILFPPHATVLIETVEVLATGENIGGTCHSKVGIAAKGLAHIGTMMGPNFAGHCLVPIHNITDRIITLKVNTSFMSVVFNYLDTPVDEKNATIGGHIDKFSTLGVQMTEKQLTELNADWKSDFSEIKNKMLTQPTYIEYKKNLHYKKIRRFFSKSNLITFLIFICLLGLLYCVAFSLDRALNVNIWEERYWDIIGAGLILYAFQLYFSFRNIKK